MRKTIKENKTSSHDLIPYTQFICYLLLLHSKREYTIKCKCLTSVSLKNEIKIFSVLK